MKTYNSEEYFSVIEKKTGRKIMDCGDQLDALYMVSMDSQNRTIVKNKFLMGQVINVELPKELPTNEIVGTEGSWSRSEYASGNGPGQLPQIKLPEGQGKPVLVN